MEMPWYPGSSRVYHTTQYYRNVAFSQVLQAAGPGCDWLYALRRYNGSGVNSYIYQAIALSRLAEGLELRIGPSGFFRVRKAFVTRPRMSAAAILRAAARDAP